MYLKSIKKISPVILIVISFTCLEAQDKGFGAGLYLGEPTGIGMKGWVNKKGAIAGAVAWSFVRNGHLQILADYHWHVFNLINVEQGKLPLYYGVGAKIVFENEPVFGARIPLGINYIFEDLPLDVFAELVPGLELIPETDFDFSGGAGVRYYFNQ